MSLFHLYRDMHAHVAWLLVVVHTYFSFIVLAPNAERRTWWQVLSLYVWCGQGIKLLTFHFFSGQMLYPVFHRGSQYYELFNIVKMTRFNLCYNVFFAVQKRKFHFIEGHVLVPGSCLHDVNGVTSPTVSYFHCGRHPCAMRMKCVFCCCTCWAPGQVVPNMAQDFWETCSSLSIACTFFTTG